MKLEEVIVVCVFIGVVIITYIIVFFIMKSYKTEPQIYVKNPKKDDSKMYTTTPKQRSCGTRETYNKGNSKDSDFFYIHNHLSKNIKVYITNEYGKKVHLLDIQPQSKKSISKDYAEEAFNNKNKITVYTLERGLTPIKPPYENLFGEYKLKIPNDTMPKEFHIGMITSKSIGSHYDENVIPIGAVQGRSIVYIHNNTNTLLKLNHNITIPPKDKLRYHGEYFLGVALGTVLKDTSENSIFPDFIYKVPATDIVYGVTSDTFFPSYAGFDLDEKSLLDIPHEPNFLLQEGFMGGPSFGFIDPDFIPVEGFPLSAPVDRWGNTITDKKKIKEWPHADNRKPITLEGGFEIV